MDEIESIKIIDDIISKTEDEKQKEALTFAKDAIDKTWFEHELKEEKIPVGITTLGTNQQQNGERIEYSCPMCHKIISRGEQYCPSCGCLLKKRG